MVTVFHDTPAGERLALVINGDRRRLVKLLDDPTLKSETDVAVIAVTPDDDLASLMGRSLFDLWKRAGDEDETKVLVALAEGQDKTTETLRLTFHRTDLSAVFWSADFNFEDLRANQMPSGVIVDLRQTKTDALTIVESALSQAPPIPVLAITDDQHIDRLRAALEIGVSDFLVWPFQPGEAQAALSRTVAIGPETLSTRPTGTQETEAGPDVEAELEPDAPATAEVEPVAEAELEPDAPAIAEVEPVAEVELEPEAPAITEVEPVAEVELEPEETDPIERMLAKLLAEQLSAGGTVTLKGLGVLTMRHETSRIVHDDQGRTIVEPPRRAVLFTPEDGPNGES
jgi:DNA-binding NarL/FixJ family response regulator/nucleoid DNA-binding protein